MEWRSFAALKQGTRQVPRIDELERLASVLGCDPGFVFQVARGVEAEEVARLLSRESRLRAIIERFHDGVFTMDPQGRLQDANPGLAELVGVEQAELLARTLPDLVAPESMTTVLGALAAIARDGRARGVDLVLRRPDGQTRAVTLDATRVTDPDGTFLGAQAVVRDVTVERQLASALEQQRRTLHVIFDSIPAACILFEADATIAKRPARARLAVIGFIIARL